MKYEISCYGPSMFYLEGAERGINSTHLPAWAIMFNFFRRPMNFKTGTSNDMKDVRGPYVE